MAAEGDRGQSVVVYADGFPVAAEGELGDGVEPREDGIEVGRRLRGGVESEAVAALPLDGEPSVAHQGAALPVAGAQRVEYQSQALVGDLRRVIRLLRGISDGSAEVVVVVVAVVAGEVEAGIVKAAGAAGGIAVGGGGLTHSCTKASGEHAPPRREQIIGQRVRRV